MQSRRPLRDRATDADKVALYHRRYQNYMSLAAGREGHQELRNVMHRRWLCFHAESLPILVENSLQIAWDFLDASGEI
jgi:hypothetical protein